MPEPSGAAEEFLDAEAAVDELEQGRINGDANDKSLADTGASISPVAGPLERLDMSFAKPERLTPPVMSGPAPGVPAAAKPQANADVSPSHAPLTVSAPTKKPDLAQPAVGAAPADAPARADAPATLLDSQSLVPLGKGMNLKAEARRILNFSLDNTSCESAFNRLADDAWALDAMVELGFCKAAAGDLSAADTDFKRLLTYTPDNWQALVGRALIAASRDQTDFAIGFFQDALNVLPPIEESNRIVEALGRL